MTGPAAIDDPALATRPFRYDAKAVESVLGYLSRRRVRGLVETARYVEPFQLQLICQRFERIAADRQCQSSDHLVLTMRDIGGEPGLLETLKDFYRRALAALPARRVRKAVRRLCENYLISPEGRRLSLEENEIRRQLRLSSETLRQLASSRLLRSDNRADSTYYELSHDALITPVLATRQARGLLFGSLGLVAGGILLLSALLISFFLFYFAVQAVVKNYFWYFGYDTQPSWTANALMAYSLGRLTYPLRCVCFFENAVRRWATTMRRYVRRKQPEYLQPVMATTKDLLLGWFTFFLVVSPFVLVSVFVQTCIIFLLLSYWLAPGWAEGTFRKELPLFFERRPALDTGMYLIWASAALLLGMEASRWAYRRLRPSRRLTNLEMVRSRAGKMGLLQGWLLIAGGAIGLLAVLFVGLEIALTVECAYYSQGRLPDWAPADWWPLSDLFQNCQTKHKEGLSFEEALSVVYTLGVLVFAVNWLLRGVRTVRSFLGGVSRPRVGKECG